MTKKMNPFSGGFRVTSPYGTRTLNGEKEFHKGLDIVGVKNREVRAVVSGKVVSSRIVTDKNDPTWQWGNYICVAGDDGNCIYYCHLESRSVKKGQRVKAGEVIGIMGNTGYSFGAHTHLEIRKGDRKTVIHPGEYLRIKNAAGEYDIEEENLSPWAADAFEWAKECGILRGSTDTDGIIAYMPQKSCTREELAVFLYRFYELLKGEIYGRGDI